MRAAPDRCVQAANAATVLRGQLTSALLYAAARLLHAPGYADAMRLARELRAEPADADVPTSLLADVVVCLEGVDAVPAPSRKTAGARRRQGRARSLPVVARRRPGGALGAPLTPP